VPEVGEWIFRYFCSLFIGNAINLRPLCKIIFSDQKLSVSLVVPWEWPCYIDGYLFERNPNIVLVHLASVPGPRVATGCTGVALSATFVNIASCLKSVEPLPKLIQGFVDTQMAS
jgi:hypothetical protein